MSSSKTPAEKFRHEVIKTMANSIRVAPEKIDAALEKPPESTGAELALPCYSFAKERGKSPVEAANNIVKSIKKSRLVARAQAFGPYINFYADWNLMNTIVLEMILSEDESYGCRKQNKPEKIMVEYSSPNTNKPLHLGHLRNDALGMALSNILESVGYRVTKAILYSNRGMGISKCMLAYDNWGRGRKPGKKKPDQFVGDFYTMFEKRKSKGLEKKLQETLRKWEEGDSKTRTLWKMMDSWVIDGFKQTYKAFGSEFDVEFRESDFYDKAGPIIKRGLKKKVFFRDYDGAIVADLEKQKLGKKVILRPDGTSVYITNDLTLTPHKFEKFNIDRSVWVVGSEQDLYFQQLFKILELLGYSWARPEKGMCMHYSYGLVYLPEGKMKSREGDVVDADEIMDEMAGLAKKEILKREKGIRKKELEKRARAIGIGALKYFLLKMDHRKNIHFKPKESVSFEGDTGPYIQYSHARACSILRKAGRASSGPNFDAKRLKHEKEKVLIQKLMEFPETVEKAAKYLKPNYIANYAHGLATYFNDFYEAVPVVKGDSVQRGHREIRKARLALVKAAAITLRNALALLGIEAPERM